MNFQRIIISQIKIKGNLNLTQKSQRYIKVTYGKTLYKSKSLPKIFNQNEIAFQDINLHIKPENFIEGVIIQVIEEHSIGINNQNLDQWHSKIVSKNLEEIRGQFLQVDLLNSNQQKIGILILIIEIFERDRGFSQKLRQNITTERTKKSSVKDMHENHIREILNQNLLSPNAIKICSSELDQKTQDTQLIGKECFLQVHYGKIKNYTKLLKTYNSVIKWAQEIQFVTDPNEKFQFFFGMVNDLGHVVYKAKGQAKMSELNQNSKPYTQIPLFDSHRRKYAELRIKFREITLRQVPSPLKPDKKLKQESMHNSLQEFNKVYFNAKYGNHLLSQNLYEQQLRQLEQRNAQLNPQQRLLREQNKRFVQFLQKELIKFQREAEKKQKLKKKERYHNLFLPNVKNEQKLQGGIITNRSTDINGLKLPKI